MIKLVEGNLLEADAEALVNTVNCVGYMGKGIALQFKQAYPENFRFYAKACRDGAVQPGRMLVCDTGQVVNPKYIINFPTKRHWRANSRLEDIEAGLTALGDEIRTRSIKSVAVPPLGCGHGGLSWSVVRPLIEATLKTLEDVEILLYEPKGAPPAREMPVRTERPAMTPARALLVALMDRYAELEYPRTLLETQKLAYFLQEAGEPLRLEYEPGHYGPYATNLNKVLERIEGHFTRGYGDCQSPDAEIELLPGAMDEAASALAGHGDSQARLQRVADLIAGFETPYGMELLATVHWTAKHCEPPATYATQSVDLIHGWNERKRRLFKPDHIATAWERLAESGWI